MNWTLFNLWTVTNFISTLAHQTNTHGSFLHTDFRFSPSQPPSLLLPSQALISSGKQIGTIGGSFKYGRRNRTHGRFPLTYFSLAPGHSSHSGHLESPCTPPVPYPDTWWADLANGGSPWPGTGFQLFRSHTLRPAHSHW